MNKHYILTTARTEQLNNLITYFDTMAICSNWFMIVILEILQYVS